MGNPKKKRDVSKEDTEEMLREYWKMIESEPKRKGTEDDNIEKSSKNGTSDVRKDIGNSR